LEEKTASNENILVGLFACSVEDDDIVSIISIVPRSSLALVTLCNSEHGANESELVNSY
jgi:hypothetical protein